MKTRRFGRFLIALLCALLALGLMTLSALAETIDHVEYVKRSWTGTAITTETVSESNVAAVPSDGSMTSGWYYLNSNVNVNGRISLTGDTNLILGDGKTLNVKGLYIPEGSTLTIYGQSDGASAGKIVSKPSGGAGIGAYSDHKGGDIIIHGGTIEATGGDHCAGIGSNDGNGTTSPITIFGGTITAKGGSDGAGIGGGRKCDGGTITIYGGTITAKGGGENGSGIGGGDSADGGTIEIFGGTITANKDPNEDGAGIGGGDAGNGGNITIHGGTITCWSRDGAGIGGGDNGESGTITIHGGTITCWDEGAANGARIGGGCDADGETITITGGTIHVYFRDGAGIGGGDSGDGGTITISGGSVYTHPKGEGNGAGIGGGNNAGDGGTITITGGYVNAVSKHGAGIGGGQEDDYIQFPDNSGDGAKLTISGGEVHATSAYAFGIGCGGAWFDNNDIYRVIGPDINGTLYGSAGNITIRGDDTVVYATGVPGGIGGDSGSLTITGGEVHASGRPDYKEGHDGGGHGIFMDGSSSRITIRGGIVYADGYGYGSYPYSGENYVGISTQASAVEITGGTVIATSQYGAGIGGVETDDSKMHGSLLISGPNTVVHASSVRNVGIGCSDWDNKKAKWTFDRYATIEVTSGGDSDKIQKNSVRINEVGAKITAGDSKETAKLLTAKEKEKAHSKYQYRRIELCAHDQGQADESGKCAFCGGKDGYCYVIYELDSDTAYMVDLVEFGDCATQPENIPDRPGYELTEWHLMDKATGTPVSESYKFDTPVAKDITLRAKWIHTHGEGITFEPWTSDGSLPAKPGNYYLTKDVALNEGWTWTSGTLNLCLAGHAICGNDLSEPVLSVAGALNLYDEGDGAVTQADGQADTIHVAAGGAFSLYGGTVSGAPDSYSGVSADGSFHMTGGAVSGNGRGVTVEDGGTFTVSGSVQVTDNAQGNVCLQEGSVIGIGGPLESAQIGVTADHGGVITSGLSGKGSETNFLSDSGAWRISLNADGEAVFEHVHQFSLKASGSAITATCAYPEFCDLPGGTAAFRVLAPAKKTYGDDKSAEATVQGEIPGITAPNIVYRKDGEILNAAPIRAGTYTAEITMNGDEGAVTASVSYTIRKATPHYTEPTGLTAVYGQTLADVSLAEWPGWAWANSAEPVEPGPQELDLYLAFYTPEDTDNYEIVRKGLEITVGKAPNPAYITPMVYLTKEGDQIDLSPLSPDDDGLYIRMNGTTGTITYEISEGENDCTLSSTGVLTPGSQTGDVIVTVNIAEDDHYEALTKRITVTVTDKSFIQLSIVVSTPNCPYGTVPTITYRPPSTGEEPRLFTFDGTMWNGKTYGPTPEMPKEVGSYTVSIIYEEGNNVYSGSENFSIVPLPLTDARVTLNQTALIYSGSRQSVEVTVGINEETLIENKDYTVSGNSGTNVGRYTVTVTGRGNYTGKATTVFTISRPEFGKAAITLPAGLKRLEANAFTGDFTDEDAEIVIDAKNCAYIGTGAFSGCKGLMKVRISGDCIIDTDAFGEENSVGKENSVYIFCAAQNESAKNYCSTHNNCVLVLESANLAGK